FALLRPPRTGCPVCLVRRIRATRPDRAMADFPLGTLLGACSEPGWPSDTAAAALVAHRIIGAAGDAPDEAVLAELDFDTWARVDHPVLRLPRCPACAPPARSAEVDLRDAPAVTVARSWQRMSRAVDPLTGVVADLRVRPSADRSSTAVWASGGTDTRSFSPVRASCVGGATKHDPVDAKVCALGEVFERYAAGIYDPDRFVRACLADLGDAAVDPRDLPLGSPREYEATRGVLVPYRPDLVIDWVRGTRLDTGEPRYVPACAVHVPYRPPSRRERLLHPNSTGLAAGSTVAQAVRAGLSEVVERDAVAVFWYNALTPPTLDWSTLDPDDPARAALERLRREGIEVVVKDLTTDLGLPAVLALGRGGDAARPVAVCGFRADVDLRACLPGAVAELEHVLHMYRSGVAHGRAVTPGAEPADMWDFGMYYCHPDRVGLLDFLAEGPVRPVGAPGPARSDFEAVRHVVERLAAAGHQAIAVDITPVDVAECGVHVVRTVVPGLQPVGFSGDFRRLGGRRVYEAPVRMGSRDRPLTEDEVNPHPVPMG
ncbi:MAG: TOMM precursor leader peptide-binding protein, partial [Saccharothrix sp.]|nr:TOMM precursor leader peptide-binding protein [Saccharothrix sp.]